MRSLSKRQLSLQSTECLTGLADPLPKHSLTWLWVEASIPRPVDLVIGLFGCPPNMAAGFLQSERSNRKQGRSHNAFYEPALEVTPSFP